MTTGTMREGIKNKFKIRNDMIHFGIFFGTIAAITFAFRPVLGMGNALALANSVIMIYISLSNDYTTKIYTNTAFFSAVYIGLGLLAWVADLHIALKGVVFFGVILFMSYTMNRGKRAMLYLQFMINFIFMLYNPVSGMELVVRLIILEASVIAMMITQWIVNRNKFRVNVMHSVRRVSDKIETYADRSMEDIAPEKNEELYKETEKRITECSSIFFTKFEQVRQWERGEEYLRLLSVLKGLGRIIYRFNAAGERMSRSNYEKIKSIIKSVDDYNFEKSSFDKLLEDFGRLNADSKKESEEEIFIDEELSAFSKAAPDTEELQRKEVSGFSGFRFLYSLKTALMAAAGVVIISLIGLPYEYWYPINICILSQPFAEISRKKSGERLVNTVLATGIVFVAFSITDHLWVHILIMAALVFFGDIFFKFNFFTLYAAFMALIMGNTVGDTGIGELTLLRILYVAVASGVVIIVDRLFSSGKLRTILNGLLEESRSTDNAIMQMLLSEDFSGSSFRKMFAAKLKTTSKIINMRSFYKDPKMDALILDGQTAMRMYNATSEYVVRDNESSGEIMRLFREGVGSGTFAGIKDNTSGRNIFVLYVLYDLYDSLRRSGELTASIQAELK